MAAGGQRMKERPIPFTSRAHRPGPATDGNK
jgi:hypothetical protein